MRGLPGRGFIVTFCAWTTSFLLSISWNRSSTWGCIRAGSISLVFGNVPAIGRKHSGRGAQCASTWGKHFGGVLVVSWVSPGGVLVEVLARRGRDRRGALFGDLLLRTKNDSLAILH